VCSRIDEAVTWWLIVDFIESLLASKDVKGFPIVSADAPRRLVGFINRTDIRYLLGVFYSPRVLLSADHSIRADAEFSRYPSRHPLYIYST